MIKGSIHEEYVTFINIYVPNKGVHNWQKTNMQDIYSQNWKTKYK